MIRFTLIAVIISLLVGIGIGIGLTPNFFQSNYLTNETNLLNIPYPDITTADDKEWYNTTLFGVILGGVLAFVGALATKAIWNRHTRPKMIIEDRVTVRDFKLKDFDNSEFLYHGNRIKVVNKGRTAAEDCKAFLVIGNSAERISWLIPKGDYTITLNALDAEYVNVCAIRSDYQKRVAPTERGYGEKENDSRILDGGQIYAKLRISAKNTDVIERRIKIMDKPVDGPMIVFYNV